MFGSMHRVKMDNFRRRGASTVNVSYSVPVDSYYEVARSEMNKRRNLLMKIRDARELIKDSSGIPPDTKRKLLKILRP